MRHRRPDGGADEAGAAQSADPALRTSAAARNDLVLVCSPGLRALRRRRASSCGRRARWPSGARRRRRSPPAGRRRRAVLALPQHAGRPGAAWPATVRQRPARPVAYWACQPLVVVAAVAVAFGAWRLVAAPGGLGGPGPRRVHADAGFARPPGPRRASRWPAPSRGGSPSAGPAGGSSPPSRRPVLAVVGPTGCGKTAGFAIPALLEWEGPVIATSVKADLLDATIAHRRRRGNGVGLRPDRCSGARALGVVAAHRLRDLGGRHAGRGVAVRGRPAPPRHRHRRRLLVLPGPQRPRPLPPRRRARRSSPWPTSSAGSTAQERDRGRSQSLRPTTPASGHRGRARTPTRPTTRSSADQRDEVHQRSARPTPARRARAHDDDLRRLADAAVDAWPTSDEQDRAGRRGSRPSWQAELAGRHWRRRARSPRSSPPGRCGARSRGCAARCSPPSRTSSPAGPTPASAARRRTATTIDLDDWLVGRQHDLRRRHRPRAGPPAARPHRPGAAGHPAPPTTPPPRPPAAASRTRASSCSTRPATPLRCATCPATPSTARSHGITLVTVWQDLAQIRAIYGDRAQTVLNNHRAKLFGTGIADDATLEYVSPPRRRRTAHRAQRLRRPRTAAAARQRAPHLPAGRARRRHPPHPARRGRPRLRLRAARPGPAPALVPRPRAARSRPAPPAPRRCSTTTGERGNCMRV